MDIKTEARHFLARAYAEYGDDDSADKILNGPYEKSMYFPLAAIEAAIKSERSKRDVDSFVKDFVDKNQWIAHLCEEEKKGHGKFNIVTVVAKDLAPKLAILEKGFQKHMRKPGVKRDE